MLILQRKKNQSIILNDNIEVTILDVGTDWVKVAIEAPKEVKILRSELLEAAKANKEASSIDDVSMQTLKNILKKDDNK